MKIFKQIPATERLPAKSGRYWTNKGEQTLFTNPQHSKRWAGGIIKEPCFAKVTGLGGLQVMKVKWWMEEIDLPSGEEVLKAAKEDAQEMWGNLHDKMIPGSIRSVGESNEIGFITGCDFIMNKIIL